MASILRSCLVTSLLLGISAAKPLPADTVRTCETQYPRPGVCAVRGHAIAKAVTLLKTTHTDYPSDCRDACFAASRCVSMEWNPSTSTCSLYRGGLGNRNIKKNKNGSWLWNRSCFVDCHKVPQVTGVQGFEYAVYHHDPVDVGDDDYAWVFDPEVYKTATPDFVGTGSAAGFQFPSDRSPGDPYTLYNNYTVEQPEYMTIMHRGYLAVQRDGFYSMNATATDAIIVWIGDAAYSGWNRDNYVFTLPGGEAEAFGVNMRAGDVLPFRALYSNNGGDFHLEVNIFYSDLDVADEKALVSIDSAPNASIIQYSTNGNGAPKFADFGQEV